MKKQFAAIAAAALTGILILGGCGQAQSAAGQAVSMVPGTATVYLNDSEPETITVTATASLNVEPDMAEISLGVVSRESTAADAQAQNTEKVKEVVETLKGLGVAETSIQTTEFYIYPEYDYGAGEERLIGYSATTYLKVSDLPIEKAGSVITECVKAGINNVNSLRYFSSVYDETYQKALEQAVADARVKAEGLAAAAGAELTDPPTITEGYQDMSYRYDNMNSYAMETAAAEADEAGGINLNGGTLAVTARVTVTYKLYMSPTDDVEEAIEQAVAE